jgi:hypothetical protein
LKTQKAETLLLDELRNIAQIFKRTEKEMQTDNVSPVRVSPFDPETQELKVAISGTVFTIKVERFTNTKEPLLNIREGAANFVNLVPLGAGGGSIRWKDAQRSRTFGDTEELCKTIALEPYNGKLFKS